jgi:four helix bundle protein
MNIEHFRKKCSLFNAQCSIVILRKEPNLLLCESMKSEKSQSDQLEERLIDFAVCIIQLSSGLPKTAAGRHIALQILRSGTAAAPNYAEARGGESRADFVHKLGIVQKELNETSVWLRIVLRISREKSDQIVAILQENVELARIITASIRTAKAKMTIEH